MELEKIKNLTDEELVQQEKTSAEQLFRLRFQIRSGQQEGVKKLRELKKDIARMKTVARFRQLHGGAPTTTTVKAAAPKAAKKAAGKAVKKPATRKAAPAKKVARKKVAKSAKGAK